MLLDTSNKKRIKAAVPSGKYAVHPGVGMVQKWVAELEAKTGWDLDGWYRQIKRHAPLDEKGRREWLKSEHGVGTNTAWWLVESMLDRETWGADPDTYLRQAEIFVEDMYAAKPDLLPIYNKLLKLARSLGKDVEVCPCKTIVPIYRKHVFAQLKPTTRTCVDLALALGADVPFTDHVLDTGGLKKKDRLTHRIGISSIEEIDDEVVHWLKVAYENGGEKMKMNVGFRAGSRSAGRTL